MLKAPSQLDELRPLMFPSLQRAPDHPTPLQPFATSPVPVMFGPNITGDFNAQPNSLGDNFKSHATGAFLTTDPYPGFINNGTLNLTNGGYEFDASESNATYGKASTVQPSSVRFLPCIKI